jgi:hypothetical protein
MQDITKFVFQKALPCDPIWVAHGEIQLVPDTPSGYFGNWYRVTEIGGAELGSQAHLLDERGVPRVGAERGKERLDEDIGQIAVTLGQGLVKQPVGGVHLSKAGVGGGQDRR